MRIKFGLDLDGVTAPQNCLDEVACGPLQLLDILETRLGLKGKVVCQARRVLQFRQLLQSSAPKGNPFYACSLTKDPIATAEVLLRWRDELMEAGWNGERFESPRLAALAEVEAGGSLSTGWADRLRMVVEALAERSPQFTEIIVLERREHLPHLWQVLFERLGGRFDPVDQKLAAPRAPKNSDLGRLQRALLDPAVGKVKLKGDGSFQIFRAYSEVTLAHALPRFLSNCPAQNEQPALLIADGQSNLLDLTLEQAGEARLGLHPFSLARAVPQVLRLALRLHWRPVDPQHLLEFLTHPVCPVQRKLARALANAVRACPGVGNRLWHEAIEKVRQAVQEECKEAPEERKKALKRIDSDLHSWLEIPRHDPAVGAPAPELARCCANVASWAAAKAASADKAGLTDLFYTLAAMAGDLRDCLSSLDTVTHAQLARLLEEVSGTGWRCSAPHAEAGHFDRVAGPGAVLEPASSIFWWNCVAPAVPGPAFWSAAERSELAEHGIHLVSPAAQAEHAHARWLRPILAAESQLVLFCPRQSCNAPLQPHPLINRLSALLEKGTTLPSRDLDQAITTGQATAPVRFQRIAQRALRPRQRWWKLPRPIAPRTAPESFSSAAKFIFQPYAWVLSYKACLKPGILWQDRLMDGGRQKGVLLHRLADLLFAPEGSLDWLGCSREQFDTWLRPAFDQLIESEGCNLLLLGRISEQKTLLKTARRSLWSLVEHLRKAGVCKVVTARKPDPIPFAGGQMSGEIDLLAVSPSASAVVDLKLGGYQERREELARNLHLQLAIYCCLQSSGSTASLPHSAFYILSNGRLMAQELTFFPDAQEIRPQEQPAGTKVCWEEFQEIWNWRKDQMDGGWIELTVNPPDDALAMAGAPDSTPPILRWLHGEIWEDTCPALTGWGENQ